MIPFIFYNVLAIFIPILSFLIPFLIWLFFALNPKSGGMVKQKFNYKHFKAPFHGVDIEEQNIRKIPGKIVGVKEYTSYHYSYKHHQNNSTWHAKLIVEYENPYTYEKEEYITKDEINCNPFYYLKSLDVTVYYLDENNIWVDDFKRIKRMSDNIAYQTTGKANGKDPGILRYEKWEK